MTRLRLWSIGGLQSGKCRAAKGRHITAEGEVKICILAFVDNPVLFIRDHDLELKLEELNMRR